MINKILVANRGEIAVRIIRCLKMMGITTVAVYSEPDADGLWVKMADQSVCIGSRKSEDSYLSMNNLISAALYTHCQAIHPGVGFLSESGTFARRVTEAGLIFVGPLADTIDQLGNKIEARHLAEESGLDITPGSHGAIKDFPDAKKIAEEIGYPVILKASMGGGGKGMRIIRGADELEDGLNITKREAGQFFGDNTIHMEAFLDHPRHIEVQLLSDGKGNVIFLGERDCSVQKNHQKLIEESPSPAVSSELRNNLEVASTKLFKKLNYRGAGTIEFLVQDKHCCFMEVNARIQVEHSVSEEVSGIDLIKQMTLICDDKPSLCTEGSPTLQGHSMEVRINALSCGKITKFNPPIGRGVRVDTHIYEGFTLTPYYDALLAKIIVHTDSRKETLRVMEQALNELEIEGIQTNKSVIQTILHSKQFSLGNFNTNLYPELEKEGLL